MCLVYQNLEYQDLGIPDTVFVNQSFTALSCYLLPTGALPLATSIPTDLVSSLLQLLHGSESQAPDLSNVDGTFAAEEAAYFEAVSEFNADAYKFTQEMSLLTTAAGLASSTAAAAGLPAALQIITGDSETAQWAVDLSDFVVPAVQSAPSEKGLSRRSLQQAGDVVPDIWIPGIYRSKVTTYTCWSFKVFEPDLLVLVTMLYWDVTQSILRSKVCTATTIKHERNLCFKPVKVIPFNCCVHAHVHLHLVFMQLLFQCRVQYLLSFSDMDFCHAC